MTRSNMFFCPLYDGALWSAKKSLKIQKVGMS